jgi:hypothetical protein
MPDGWRKLSPDEIKNPNTEIPYNPFPDKSEEVNSEGKYYYETSLTGENGFIYWRM